MYTEGKTKLSGVKAWTITFPGNILLWFCSNCVANDSMIFAMIFFAKFFSSNHFVLRRWPEPIFQTLTPLLFQNFWIRFRQFFKFENPTTVQTPATIIDPTVIYPCFYIRNDHTAEMSTDRTGSGLKPILSGSGLDRTAIFFENWRTGLDLTEKMCSFNVNILKISKILVVILFQRFAKW